jgi:hypothetical protein
VPNIDRSLYKAINRFADRTAWAHGLARLYAKDGIALFAVLLVVGWWLGRASSTPVRSVAQAGLAGAGALLALAVNQPIGAAIDRARPYATIPTMHLLVDKTTDFSFSFTKKFKDKPEEDMPYQYNFVDNDSYVRSVDPAIFLKVQKADKPETEASMKLYLFGQYGDTPVDVYRPSDRLLVVKPERGTAEIYAKCPS